MREGMDPRVREHAEVLVNHSTEIEQGDHVLIRGQPAAEDRSEERRVGKECRL